MKFSKREDIEAPLDVVFRAVSDFRSFERAALRRGIEVSRRDELEQPAPGMAWAARAPIRGKLRDIALRLTSYAPSTALAMFAESAGMLAVVTVDLVALARNRTRVQVGLEMTGTTMASRLLLQSLKLGKAALDRRFAARIADFAIEIETRQKKSSKPI